MLFVWILFGLGLFSSVFYPFFSYADAFGHVENSAVFSNAVKNGGGEMAVIDKGTPFVEPELGSNDGTPFLSKSPVNHV